VGAEEEEEIGRFSSTGGEDCDDNEDGEDEVEEEEEEEEEVEEEEEEEEGDEDGGLNTLNAQRINTIPSPKQ